MIKYNLKCNRDHEFESWFSSSEEFEKLNKKKLLECIYCSSKKIEKSIMSPMISYSKSKDEHIKLLDLHLIHFIRIFLKQVEENNNGTKKERIEEIQYSLNQILEDVRELKDD